MGHYDHNDHEHSHEHNHTHTHAHAHDGVVHSHAHDHVHAHDHAHDHTHDHLHAEGHEHHHHHDQDASCGGECGSCSCDCQHTPREELVALMKYMVGHNASHANELAALAKQLEAAGEKTAYEQVMAAVADFEKGNMRLSVVLAALDVK